MTALADCREPELREPTFLDFFDFHLEHRAHPGGVYYLIPYLREREGWDEEETLWYCVLNGNTQNPLTSWLLHKQGSRPKYLNRLLRWWRAFRPALAWDTDRRYYRTQLDVSLEGYLNLLRGQTQEAFWRSRAASWSDTWAAANSIPTFGRLSAWSYAEYLYIAGYGADADHLVLGEPGSISHRNGLALLAGGVWQTAPYRKDRSYNAYEVAFLSDLGEEILLKARARTPAATRLTLESALCTYKSWHKPNRRYPNVYNDMLHDRIRQAEERFPAVDFALFWDARRESLPARLRLEATPSDPGLHPLKQNHYRETGRPVVMYAGTELESAFDIAVREGTLGTFR